MTTKAKFINYDESSNVFTIEHEEAGILDLPAHLYTLCADEMCPQDVIGKIKELDDFAESYIYGIG